MRLSGFRHAVLTAAFSLFIGAGAATASTIPISFTDTFDPANPYVFGASPTASVTCVGTNGTSDSFTPSTNCNSLTWTHTLAGFSSATDTLTSAAVAVSLYNDRVNDQPESFNLDFDLGGLLITNQGGFDSIATTTFTYNSVTFAVLLSMLGDGQLALALQPHSSSANNDFYFDKSVLTASGTRVTAPPVPEPATLTLLGLGLALAGTKMRAARKR